MFKSDLNLIEIVGASDLWRFGASLVWEDSAGQLVVPKGFITDLASIPHWLDWMPDLDRTGLSRRPAALHDWLYATQKPKAYCDDILHQALLAEGMDPIGAKEFYDAVHIFGAKSYAADGRKLVGHTKAYVQARGRLK